MYPALATALVSSDEARALARSLVKSRAADWVDIVPAAQSWIGWLDHDGDVADRSLLLVFTSDGRAETVASLLAEASLATLQLVVPVHMELDIVAGGVEVVG